ncbi:lysozyme C, milk isozyme-like [Tiliqua scincoides]|uniref:lysozyme C, milk isozyme-like n=1 Tax=Tiliqua scincoides TaxID=71010 RepID=UPI0034630155
MKACVLVLFCLLIATKEAKVFKKCELYSYLKKLGLDRFHGFRLDHWICLALFSSKFDTAHYEFDGKAPYYGIFQLSGLIWCSNGRHFSENRCQIDCDRFLDDDITDDVLCAKKVISQNIQEMMSWPRYAEYCTLSMPEVSSWECK